MKSIIQHVLCPLPEGIGHYMHGEVYRVDKNMLGALDVLEGHPHYYTRVPIDVRVTRRQGTDVDGEAEYMENDEVVLKVQSWMLPSTHYHSSLLEKNAGILLLSYAYQPPEAHIESESCTL